MDKKIIKYILGGLLIVIGLYLIFGFGKGNTIDDYYTYVNEKELEKHELKEDEMNWSLFSEYQDEINEETDNMLKQLIESKSNKNLNILYNKLSNESERNKNGISSLKKYFKIIDSSKNINEFIRNAINIEKDLNVSIFLGAQVLPDFKNTKKNIIYLAPTSFDFGSEVYYYSQIDYESYRAIFKQYQIKFLKQYGYDEDKARGISNKIYEIQKDIASKSKDQKYYLDSENIYNVYNKNELKQLFKNFDINYYLKAMGIDNEQYFSVADKDNFVAIDSYLTNNNLGTFKEYLKVRILEAYSQYISTDYDKLSDELFNKLSGVKKEYDFNENVKDTLKSTFLDVIEKEYSVKSVTEEEKKYVSDLIDDIIDFYKDEINTLDWMSSTTKEKAILKLSTMNKNIGYDENSIILSNSYNLRGDLNLIDNIILINKANNKYALTILSKNLPTSAIPQTTVNAYYSPQYNSINFPCAFFKFLDVKKSYYENLGSVGMIIGHEITHAFDTNGSKFDENGNLNNWWTDSDREKFDKLKEKVIDYYSQYEIDGYDVNGEITVSENIADLGGLNSIVQISKKKKASNEEMKQLFESFASMWINKYNDNFIKLSIISDTHSPNKIRVNATLSSCDEFYEVYNISSKDEMYFEEEDRVKVW